MLDLAIYGGDEYVSLREISDRQDISLKYLEQIVSLFNKNGFIKSVRGPQGGFRKPGFGGRSSGGFSRGNRGR